MIRTPRDEAVLEDAVARFADAHEAVALVAEAERVVEARILWVNDAFLRLTSYRREDVVGATARLIRGEHPDAIGLDELQLLHDHQEGSRFGIVASKERPDHTRYTTSERVEPLRDSAGNITHYLVIQQPI